MNPTSERYTAEQMEALAVGFDARELGYESAVIRYAATRITTLESALAECRRDAERLEFLAKPGIELVQEYDDDQFNFVVYREFGGRNDRDWEVLGKHESHRSAIDAAIARSETNDD